jgi:hypothetical protein
VAAAVRFEARCRFFLLMPIVKLSVNAAHGHILRISLHSVSRYVDSRYMILRYAQSGFDIRFRFHLLLSADLTSLLLRWNDFSNLACNPI